MSLSDQQGKDGRSQPYSHEDYARTLTMESLHSDGVLSANRKGIIQYVNPVLAEMAGYQPKELIGTGLTTILENQDLHQSTHTAKESPTIAWPNKRETKLILKDGTRMWVGIRSQIQRDDEGLASGLIAQITDIHERKQMEENQALVLEILTIHFHKDFFIHVCRKVAATFGSDIVMITECQPQNRVRTIAFWQSGKPRKNSAYDLAGTPCETVIGREPAFYADQVCSMFSLDLDLRGLTPESFVGVPLSDSQGMALGHLALIHSAPFPNRYQLIETLEMIASRIESEMERNLHEALLEQRNQRLEEEIAAHKQAKATIDYFRSEIGQNFNTSSPIGQSPAFKKVMENIRLVSQTEIAVLITGETGTGKELAARLIHEQSSRAHKPLVKVNCAALPQDLIEAELFGHEKGAFTSAQGQRKGRFELADGGTLFLDEIGELSLSAQAKILRVLQEKEFERVGGSVSLKVDFRLIAATNRNLEAMIAKGEFRDDLFYRISVFPINIPPLRERKADIPLLAQHFLGKYARSLGKSFSGIHPDTTVILERHSWPGNIRELENQIHRAAIVSNTPQLQVAPINELDHSGETTLEDIERRHISAILAQSGHRVEGAEGAAKLLGLNPSTLRSKMKKLGLTRKS